MNRRQFLSATLLAITSPSAVWAQSFWDQPRYLTMYRAATNEHVREYYFLNGQVYWPGYLKICNLLRDVHQHEAVQMDVVLLDILRGIQGWLQTVGRNAPIHITSGFRTVRTNSMTEGAVKNSFHTHGRAADFYVPGVTVTELANLALYLQGGGVGFYPQRGFIHCDTGNLRSWKG